MIHYLKNTGAEDLNLGGVILPPDGTTLFHPALFTEAQLGLVITAINSSNAIIIFEGAEINPSIDTFHVLVNSTNIRGIDLPLTIEEWNDTGTLIGYDYKYVRSRIAELSTDFDSLTEDEKDLACEYVVVDLDTIQSRMGNRYSIILYNWSMESTRCRLDRFEHAKIYVFKMLELADAKSVLAELTTGSDLSTRYHGGIEGTLEDEGVEGLFDYVQSRVGTTYASSGLSSKSFVPKDGLTIQDIADGVMHILTTGTSPD